MKIASYISIAIIAFWSILTISEIWGDVISMELYVKITITLALVLIGVVVASLIWREYVDDRKMKKDNFID